MLLFIPHELWSIIDDSGSVVSSVVSSHPPLLSFHMLAGNVDRARLNASGVRDTARVLRISTDTVLSELKKKEAALESVNTALLRTLHPDEVTVAIERAGEAEMDEMWSFVGNKKDQRWLWHAIDHATGAVLA